MTKLKTVNDLEREHYKNKNLISIEILKEEAVKWVKELKRFHKHKIDCNEVSWIKYFFNITEEDLK